MKRGDVYRADLPVQGGHEQQGARPAVIVYSDKLLPYTSTVVVIPFTTNTAYVTRPDCVFVARGDNGLAADSVALVFQVRAVDKRRLSQRLGTLEAATMQEIEMVLRDVLGFEP